MSYTGRDQNKPGHQPPDGNLNRYEPVREKTNNLGSDQISPKNGLYNHRRGLEAGNFGFNKWKNCTIRVAKTKVLISFAVTAMLICAFVIAYADCLFSHAAAHINGAIQIRDRK